MTHEVVSQPPFKECLAIDYYDGPTAGIAMARDESAVYFQMVAANEDLEIRLFALVEIEPWLAKRLWTGFEQLETPRFPVWVLNKSENATDEAVSQALLSTLKTSVTALLPRCVCECRDLVREPRRCVILSAEEAKTLQALMEAGEWPTITGPRILEDFLGRL